MKGALFALPVVLGVSVFVMAFVRGSEVPVPPELARRPVKYLHQGFELRLDGLAVSDPLEKASPRARVTHKLSSAGVPIGIKCIQGQKLTQGSVLLLRVGQPMARYYEAFPTAPRDGRAWRVQRELMLEVKGQSLVESIRLETAPVVIVQPMRPPDSYSPGKSWGRY